MSLPFLSVFDVLFAAVFLALFSQATNLVHLNHMHSDGGGWGVGDEEEEKRRERITPHLLLRWTSWAVVLTSLLVSVDVKIF